MHNHLFDFCSGHIMLAEREKWVSDDQLIIFPPGTPAYHDRVNKLNATQYLQRTRIIYAMLTHSN